MLPGLLPCPPLTPTPYVAGAIQTAWAPVGTPALLYASGWASSNSGQAPHRARAVVGPLLYPGRQVRVTMCRSFAVAYMSFGISAGVAQKPWITQATPTQFFFGGVRNITLGANDYNSIIVSDWADYPGVVHAGHFMVIIIDWEETQAANPLAGGWASNEPGCRMVNAQWTTLQTPQYNLSDPAWTDAMISNGDNGSMIAQVEKVEVR